MPLISVFYHLEASNWWADSPQVPGWTAVADSFDEVRRLALDGVREFVAEGALVSEMLPEDASTTGVFRSLSLNAAGPEGITIAISTAPMIREHPMYAVPLNVDTPELVMNTEPI